MAAVVQKFLSMCPGQGCHLSLPLYPWTATGQDVAVADPPLVVVWVLELENQVAGCFFRGGLSPGEWRLHPRVVADIWQRCFLERSMFAAVCTWGLRLKFRPAQRTLQWVKVSHYHQILSHLLVAKSVVDVNPRYTLLIPCITLYPSRAVTISHDYVVEQNRRQLI